jgi:hypothetical protein
MSNLMRFDPLGDFDRLAEQMMLGGGRGGPRSFPQGLEVDALGRMAQCSPRADSTST